MVETIQFVAPREARKSDAPIRVLALVTDAFGGYGGIARYNQDILEAIASAEFVKDVVVLPRLGPSGVTSPLPNLTQLGAVNDRIAYSAKALAVGARLKPSMIFSGHVYQGPLAQAVARVCGARMISQLHGTEVWHPLSRVRLRALEMSDLVLCVSRHTQACYLSQAAVQNAAVCANTVSALFSPGDRESARKQFGLENEFVLASVARLDTREGYKGHDRVIAALAKIKGPDGRKPVYLIAGEGEDRSRLEALAANLGVSDSVRFLGKVPSAALPNLYRATDLFVLPSTGEGFGIVFIEAMACGTPALGLAVGGAVDALADGELGILVHPGADLTAAIQSAALKPPPDRERLARSVRARFGGSQFKKRVEQTLHLTLLS